MHCCAVGLQNLQLIVVVRHTYHRVNRDGTFHTLWADDRSEIPA